MVFPEPRAWQLAVRQVSDPTPLMRRITLGASTLDRFSWLPGQDVSLAFTADDGSTVRRRYSIRRFDPNQRILEINVVMHGNGPGMRWARSAFAGMEIEAIAPRGKITLVPDAAWHLFAGDATAVPAAFAMMEALPEHVPALAYFAADRDERLPFEPRSRQQVAWELRADPREILHSVGLNLDGVFLDLLEPPEIPISRGHAYLAGEVALVAALKQGLVDRGWPPAQISAKAYWNRGRPNAGHGEPEQKAS